MKTKLLTILAVSLVSVVSLSGCKKSEVSDPDTLTIVTVGSDSERNIIQTFVNGYKAQPGNADKKFKFTFVSNLDDYIYKTLIRKNGVLADIIQVYDATCGYYANDGLLDGQGNSLYVPISSYMARDGILESTIVDSSLKITKCRVGSNDMYWVPRDYNKVVVAYNVEMFQKAGIAKPSDNWTWSDFRDVCEQLKQHKADVTTKDVFYPVDMNINFTAVNYPTLKTFGVDLVNPTTKSCFGDDVEGAKNAWGKLLNMVVDGYAFPGQGITTQPFPSGQAAMMFIVRPDLPSYAASLGLNNIDFVSLPSFTTEDGLAADATSYIGMGATGYGMSVHCPQEKREFAWDFLKYIISIDGQNEFSKMGSGIPCLKALLNDPNAEYTKYMSTSLNHHAFIAYPERDVFAAEYLDCLTAEKQSAVYKVVTDHALKDFLVAGSNKTYSIKDSYYATFKQLVEAYSK